MPQLLTLDYFSVRELYAVGLTSDDVSMLGQILKCLPLALSTGSLICLAVVFSGCTYTSSPSDLYFMKVHLCYGGAVIENKTKH
jgi:hypothetical protein